MTLAGVTYDVFQSTLPRGERLSISGISGWENTSFNPRSRVGSDQAYLLVHSLNLRFNPRSRVGSDIIL